MKWSVVAAGALAIVLAILIGAARLLLAQLPGYQDELRVWVTEALGVDADFDELNARLGLYGPELDLRNVTLGAAGSDQNFLAAAEASLTLDPLALVFGQRVAISRLTVSGASLDIERTEQGRLQIEGVSGQGSTDVTALIPANIDVVIRDSQVLYLDRQGETFWQFSDLDISLARQTGELTAEIRASPGNDLAERLELSLLQTGPDGEMTLTGRLAGVDLSVLRSILPLPELPAVDGRGQLEATMVRRDRQLATVQVTVAIDDLVLDGEQAAYDRLGFAADWRRAGDGGFALDIAELELARGDSAWPGGTDASLAVTADGRVASAAAGFVRLQDLEPIVSRFGPVALADQWRVLEPAGDLVDFSFAADTGAGEPGYVLASAFEELAVAAADGRPGFAGLSGEVRTAAGAGTVSLASHSVRLDWPAVLDTVVEGEDLRGTIVWRSGQDGLRILSDALNVRIFGEPLLADMELVVPDDPSGTYLDLHAAMPAARVTDAKTLLPYKLLPESVSTWLAAAIVGGSLADIRLAFTGELSRFPFDDGRGSFVAEARVSGGALAYMADWPMADALDGTIRFDNAAFSADGRGRVIDSLSQDIRVAIDDLRTSVLEIDASLNGPLANVLEFVQTAPLIAGHLGSGFDRLHSDAGSALTTIDLDLPLRSFGDYRFAGGLQITDGGLGIDGFPPPATEINGTLDIENTHVSGDGIEAIFLGGAVAATVAPAADPAYRTVIDVAGETTSDAIFEAFSLPLAGYVNGQTLWTGRLSLPNTARSDAGPLTVEVQTNLSGVALRFPEPLAKPPSEPTNLRVAFVFDGEESLAISGNLGAARRYAFELDRVDDRYQFQSGAVTFGGADPVLPLRDGVVVSGRMNRLRLDEWLAISGESSIGRARPLFYSAELEVADFGAFGQQLGETTLAVRRGDRIWSIDIDSAPIAGRIEVPQNLAYRAPIIADMDRVYLAATEAPAQTDELDPRELPGLRFRSVEFGIGSRELGRVEADVVADPRGLRLTSFASATQNFTLEGSGSWLTDGGRAMTRVAATIASSNVGATLGQLGIEPFVEGEAGELTASLYWDGPPSSAWLDHVNGDVALSVETGSMVDLDPGAGRVVGLMSIAALPRRLTLDFRDVFNKGFSFDEITGSFLVEDGNAYTDNLKLSGPAAEIGVIGRTGLRDRDYQQQAVVTAEPSNMLPTVGGLLGGPGVGAALLIFTRIFKKPLRGIGRAAYCVTGSWDEPAVERISTEDSDGAGACVELPPSIAEAADGG